MNTENSPEVVETQATETPETPETQPTEIIEEVYNTKEEETPTEETKETLLAGKFKTTEDLEKSYTELQSTFSKKLGAFEGAPEAYEGESIEAILGAIEQGEGDAGVFNALQEWGKDNQLSQDGLVQLYGNYQEMIQERTETRYNQEMEKLGQDGQARLDNVYGFLEAQLGDKSQAIVPFLSSADSIEAVEMLMKKMGSSPAQVQPQVTSKEKIQEMRFATNEHGDRLMSIDPAYRAKVLKLESQA